MGFDDHGHDSAPLSKSVRVLTVFALHKATAGVVVERAVRATALALAPKNRPTDSTVYGRSRTSPRSFYTHHLQRISLAAQLGNAKAIRLSLRARKLKAFAALGGARA